MEREFKLTENAVKNLVYSYVLYKNAYEEVDEDDSDDDYLYYQGCIDGMEKWMLALGIHPNSSFVTKMMERK